MKKGPWILAVTGLCLLHVATAFLTHPRFNCEEFEGQWFSIAVILDRGELTNTNMHQIHLKARENDSFSIMVQMPEEDCKRLHFDLCMSGKPGRFRRISGKQDNPVTVIETDYASFAIIGVQTGSIRALHLYSRTSEASDAVKEKYLFVAKCINFPVNKLIYLTVQTDMCEPPSAFPDFGDTCKAEESE